MTPEALTRIMDGLNHEVAATKMTDEELADALLHQVWAKAKFGTPANYLTAEAIDRLRTHHTAKTN